MPFLGAGVDQHVNVSTPTATWIFTPNTAATTAVRLFNEGRNTVFVGQSTVTPANGMPIPAGSRPVELQNVTQTLYACCAYAAGTTNTTLSSALTAGTTVVTVAAQGNFPVGTSFVVGNIATAQDFLTSGSSVSSATIGTTSAALYDHLSGETVTTITLAPGQLRVTAGVV